LQAIDDMTAEEQARIVPERTIPHWYTSARRSMVASGAGTVRRSWLRSSR